MWLGLARVRMREFQFAECVRACQHILRQRPARRDDLQSALSEYVKTF